jgi:hypothetical protein
MPASRPSAGDFCFEQGRRLGINNKIQILRASLCIATPVADRAVFSSELAALPVRAEN